MTAIFGALIPRFIIFVGWINDQAAWQAIYGSPLFFLLGWLFLPWTTLIYALAEPNGLSPLNLVFLVLAVLLDLGTWGAGFFATRERTSNFRDA